MESPIIKGRPSRPQVDRVMKMIEEMAERGSLRGQVLTHEQIAHASGEPRNSKRYMCSIIPAWKKRMLNEYGIQPVSESGVGYRLPDGADQVRHGISRARLGVRSIARGAKVLASTPTAELSESDLKARDHALTQINPMLEFARAQVRAASIRITPTTRPELRATQ